MNLHHLKTFYLTAKYMNVSQAAREIGIAQPAATRNLRELQIDIDIVLFNNRGKKIYLTNEGKILYKKTEKMFSAEPEIEGAIDDIKRLKSGLFSLVTQATFGDYYLPEVLLEFYKKYPDIVVSVSTSLSDRDIISSVAKMDYDIGISSVKDDLMTIKSQKLFSASQYLIVSPKHHLAKEKLITPDMLAKEVFILPEKSSRSRMLIENYFKTYGIEPKILYELGHAIPILNIVKNTTTLSITYWETAVAALEAGEIKMIPLKDPENTLVRDFYLLVHREKYNCEIMEKFIQCLQDWVTNLAL